MLCRENAKESGFTLVEVIAVIVLIGILSVVFLVAFRSTLFNYLGLQKQTVSFGQMSTQADRIANVLRGATSIESAADNELTAYAYFYPSDEFVSQVRYYIVENDGVKRLYVDLTPMTANPPLGTPDTAHKKTLLLIDNFYQPSGGAAPGGSLFAYRNANGTLLSTPVADLTVIKNVRVSLFTRVDDGGVQTIQIQIVLRNKKDNL
ncbi:hypothetical protein CSA80_04030 [Candidatus Saccharibacteria bacterium]|nr:MAG: hypothetical protein CR973_00055 [Candidatus Saccharibacteria bacterium]PID98849.1 MAG: hypothetical protein CSA80_04030 [Candidatus Saccharibacteria bacterium]